MLATHKFTIENKLFGHCATCDQVLEVDRNSELKVRRLYHESRNIRIATCPTCARQIDINNNRFSKFALYAEICKLTETLKDITDQLISIDKRVSLLEFASPNGTEFQKILSEAQDAGDFQV